MGSIHDEGAAQEGLVGKANAKSLQDMLTDFVWLFVVQLGRTGHGAECHRCGAAG